MTDKLEAELPQMLQVPQGSPSSPVLQGGRGFSFGLCQVNGAPTRRGDRTTGGPGLAKTHSDGYASRPYTRAKMRALSRQSCNCG
jgi:hypothetical protein